jgi:hypothetical protein
MKAKKLSEILLEENSFKITNTPQYDFEVLGTPLSGQEKRRERRKQKRKK